jgi:apolipoprotein N-acyltransferase
MGSNPTQAQAVLLFLIGATLIFAGLAEYFGVLLIGLGIVALAGSVALFLKCKPWEQREEE